MINSILPYNVGIDNNFYSAIKPVKKIVNKDVLPKTDKTFESEVKNLNNNINLSNVVAYPSVSSDNLFQAFYFSDNNLDNFDERGLRNHEDQLLNEELAENEDKDAISNNINSTDSIFNDKKPFIEYLNLNLQNTSKIKYNNINNQIVQNFTPINNNIDYAINSYKTMFNFDINSNPNISYMHDSLNKIDMAV